MPYSRIRELAEIAMTMDGVHKLYFGESNLPTPEFLKRAADQAMRDGFTYYTPNSGLLSTRQALARYYQRHQGVTLNPENEIVVTDQTLKASDNKTEIRMTPKATLTLVIHKDKAL